MQLSLDQQHLFFATFFYEIQTPGHRRTTSVLCDFEEIRRTNPKFTKINPQRTTIAKHANCSLETVKDAIKQANGLAITITHIKKSNGRNGSNEYELNEMYFEFMALMKRCGYLKDPEKHKEIVLNGLAEDPYFLVKTYLKKHRLSTDKLPTVDIGKLPTIRNYLKETSLAKVQSTKVPTFEHEKRTGVLAGLPLSFSSYNNLTTWFAPQDLKIAKEQYIYVNNTQRVESPGGFIYAKAKESAKKRLLA